MAAKENPTLQHVLINDEEKHSSISPNKAHSKCKIYTWFIIGLFLIIFSIQLIFIPQYINHTIKQKIIDAFIFTHPLPNNNHYNSWVSNSNKDSVPITFSVQFFNITNPNEMLQGAIPQLHLTQSIVYDEYYFRKNITFVDNGEYVKHNFYIEYIYNEEKSDVLFDEVFTVLSPLITTLYQQYNSADIIEKEALKLVIQEVSKQPELLFITKKANDLIFELLNITIYNPLTHDPIYDFSYGLMNNRSSHFYMLNTGKHDITKLGEVERYCFCNGCTLECLEDDSSRFMSSWDPPMSVSPGHLFYIGLYALDNLDNKDDVSPLWITTLYRNIYLSYNKTYNYKGVELWKYGIQFSPMLENASTYPPNIQFNQFGPSGLLNLTAPYDGLPIFLSMVLFDGAPDYMANNSKLGLNHPGKDDISYIDIEPRTGAIFYANASMQVCSPMHSLPKINNDTISGLFNLSNDMMIPVYILTYSDAVQDHIVDNFKDPLNLGNDLHTTSIILGWISVGLLIIWSVVTFYQFGKLRMLRSGSK